MKYYQREYLDCKIVIRTPYVYIYYYLFVSCILVVFEIISPGARLLCYPSKRPLFIGLSYPTAG